MIGDAASAVTPWIVGLIERGILPAFPYGDEIFIRPADEHLSVHIHTREDVYAWATIGPDGIIADGWGNHDPVHNSREHDCPCDECEEARANG